MRGGSISGRRNARFSPVLDSLESRQVPTASVAQFDTVIVITADVHSSNVVTASVLPVAGGTVVDINANGTDYTFDGNQISMILFDASQSDSSTTESFTNNTNLFSLSVAGAGSDDFTAGSYFDVVIDDSAGTQTVHSGGGFLWEIH